MTDANKSIPHLDATVAIVSAYVENNSVGAADLPKLIVEVHSALKGSPATAVPAQAPAVPVRKSITPDYLICLEDGKKFKSMQRHLTKLGLTPNQYRAKWNLPADYPMVAPNYSAKRSALALGLGFGRKVVAEVPKPRRRGKGAT